MDYWHQIRQAVGANTLIIPGAAGAIVQDGKILLVRHNLFKKWQVPGGVQEVGESIQQTVQREIREELGLCMEVRQLIGVYSDPRWTIAYPDGGRTQQLTFFFLMSGSTAPIKLQEAEVAACRFFGPDEIPDDTMDCCKQKVADWAHFSGQTVFR